MQGEEDQGNPTSDAGGGAMSLAPASIREPPFAGMERRRQFAFGFMDDPELDPVQIPVRRDDPMPEPGNRHSRECRRDVEPRGPEEFGLKAAGCRECGIDGQEASA